MNWTVALGPAKREITLLLPWSQPHMLSQHKRRPGACCWGGPGDAGRAWPAPRNLDVYSNTHLKEAMPFPTRQKGAAQWMCSHWNLNSYRPLGQRLLLLLWLAWIVKILLPKVTDFLLPYRLVILSIPFYPSSGWPFYHACLTHPPRQLDLKKKVQLWLA